MGSGSGSDRYAREQAELEKARRAKIEKGTTDVRNLFAAEFGEDFYKKISSDYNSYYQPQLEKKQLDANKALGAALNDSGQGGGIYRRTADGFGTYNDAQGQSTQRSSTGVDKFADLEEQMNIQRSDLADRATSAAEQKRSEVQNAQESVILQLQSTADSTGAMADAASRINYVGTPAPYEPLGQLFTDATFGLATQADLERRGQSKYNTGLFPQNNSGSSGTTIS
jgi:hypothetical protein